MLIACIGSSLIYLPIQALPIDVSAPVASASPKLSPEQLSQLAKSITVKVLSGETWGSGILIQRQGEVYTVLTNEHVLTPGYGKQYRIQTPDGHLYPATVSRAIKFNGNDLGLLQFRSGRKAYALASLGGASTVAEGDKVFVAGFPITDKGFFFSAGQVSLLLDKPLNGGYQIGYTNDIQNGMSGGPLLNQQGKVVGINGRHAYPLWGNNEMFQDGSVPSKWLQEQIIRMSWAVPVQTFVQKQDNVTGNSRIPNGWLW
jgi:S1-C subfamily serine protease